MTYLKDRKKNEIVWKITNKADFNSKDNTNSDGGVSPSKRKIYNEKVPLGTIHTNDGFLTRRNRE